MSDKPLATSAAEARDLWTRPRDAGVVHAVTFNYRGNPLVQQARDDGRRPASIGARRISSTAATCRTGCSSRPTSRGASSPRRAARVRRSPTSDRTGAISSQHVVGQRIVAVLADLTTVVPTRIKPAASREAFAHGRRAGARAVPRDRAKTSRRCWCASTAARKGCVTVGQVCAGHKNDLWFEVNGATRVDPLASGAAERAVDRPARRGQRACCQGSVAARRPRRARYAHLPGGHQEGWADAFCNVMRDIYTIHRRRPERAGDPRAAGVRDVRGRLPRRRASSMRCSRAIARGGVWTDVRADGTGRRPR